MKYPKLEILTDYHRQRELYLALVAGLQNIIPLLVAKEGVKFQGVYGRVKSPESLREKLNRKDKYSMLTDVTDLAALRVITYFDDDIDKVMKVIESEFDIDEENTVDKRQPDRVDSFGYKSMQYVARYSFDRLRLPEYAPFAGLKFEIQIRTILQHAWSEVDHLYRYKRKAGISAHIDRKFSGLSAQLEAIDSAFIELRNLLDDHAQRLLEQIEEGSPQLFKNASAI